MVKRDLSRKKKPKVVLPRRTFRRADDLLDEPTWDSPVESAADVRLARALNYYNYVEIRDRGQVTRRWLAEYCQSRLFSLEDVATVQRVEEWRIGSLAAMSRIILRGCVLPPEIVAAHDERIREALARHRRNQEGKVEQKKSPDKEGPTRDRTRELAGVLIAEAEEAIDRGTEFSMYERLTSTQAPASYAKAVIDYYSPVAAELELARGRSSDPQVKEAYSSMSRTQINKIVSTVTTILSDAERYSLNRRASVVKKPRKRKEKSAAQLTSRMQYLREYPELKIVSVDPSLIVGAGTVYLYNTKYKQLRRLCAQTDQGLTVSGSTIQGFDPKTSDQKSLRKPEQVIPLVLEGNHLACRRAMSDLKTKSSEPNGRVNSDTIILKTLKQR